MARHPKLLPVSIDKEAAWPGPQACSHMFWMILQAEDEFPHWQVLVAYLVYSCEQREPRMGKDRASLASLSQHQGLFQSVTSSHQVAKVLELQLLASVFSINIQD